MQTNPQKIVVIGPESTGKSTLTTLLAEHYQMPFVKEFARAYIKNLDRDYEEEDLLKIARGQIKKEEEQIRSAPKFIFCDTDLYVIKVWSEHKYHRCALWILQEIAKRKYDLYLFTDIDMPWEPDPQREYPSPIMRSYFYHIYKDIVSYSGIPWAKIDGTPQERLKKAIQAIETHVIS